jgi:hypothetical protein
VSARDIALTAVLVVAFATLVTAHVTIVAGLARRRLGWRALLALIVMPLAPFFALREHMKARGIVWLTALGSYAVALALTLTS